MLPPGDQHEEEGTDMAEEGGCHPAVQELPTTFTKLALWKKDEFSSTHGASSAQRIFAGMTPLPLSIWP